MRQCLNFISFNTLCINNLHAEFYIFVKYSYHLKLTNYNMYKEIIRFKASMYLSRIGISVSVVPRLTPFLIPPMLHYICNISFFTRLFPLIEEFNIHAVRRWFWKINLHTLGNWNSISDNNCFTLT